MKIDVLGCGSAFSTHSNTSSIRIIDSQENQWLIDCGPTIPRAIWQRGIGINEIQVIYFTHIHPDHCSGLAALINQWKSFKRTEPLTIFCQTEQKEPLEALLALSIWPEKEICFDIHWCEISDSFQWKNWSVETANTQHEISNRAIRITAEQQTLFFSGDGRPTVASEKLMNGADIAFQECASFEPLAHYASHGDLADCKHLLLETGVKMLGLYHLFDEVITDISEAVETIPKLFLSKDELFIDLADRDYAQKIQVSTSKV